MKIKTYRNRIIPPYKSILHGSWHLHINLSIQRYIFVITIIFLILTIEQWSQAQTIYTDPCVPAPGSGTEGDPYKTLNSAVAAAAPGSNIVMKGGFYRETITINKKLTLTATSGVARVGGSYGVGWKDISLDLGNGKSINARVYYPSLTTGANTQIATSCSGQGFPVIVYAHGLRKSKDGIPIADLCEWCDDALRTDITKDYLQAEGLLKPLASSGFIAISFDWHSVYNGHYNQTISPHIIDAIHYLGNKFSSYVNLQQIGLIGHSTGGSAVINAAPWVREYLSPSVVALGLIAPALPLHQEFLNDPVLIIHGTNEHPCQVGTDPFRIYCMANTSKHLVGITGANHFGYTDGICLDPSQQFSDTCTYEHEQNSLPRADGKDNPCMVGGLTGQQAQVLQQRTACNYLQAFFSKYLQGDLDALDYIVQREDEEKCRDPGDVMPCDNIKTLRIYMWWPQNLPGNICGRSSIDILDGNGILHGTITVNQGLNGGQWNHLGQNEYIFAKGASVRIRSSSGCTVVADAVSFAFPGSSPDEGIIIDNRNALWTVKQGVWNVSTDGSNIYNGDYHISTNSSYGFVFTAEFSPEFNTADCNPVRYFNDLLASGVQVHVCSCTK